MSFYRNRTQRARQRARRSSKYLYLAQRPMSSHPHPDRIGTCFRVPGSCPYIRSMSNILAIRFLTKTVISLDEKSTCCERKIALTIFWTFRKELVFLLERIAKPCFGTKANIFLNKRITFLKELTKHCIRSENYDSERNKRICSSLCLTT